jgi:hypothetical protein
VVGEKHLFLSVLDGFLFIALLLPGYYIYIILCTYIDGGH